MQNFHGRCVWLPISLKHLESFVQFLHTSEAFFVFANFAIVFIYDFIIQYFYNQIF